MVHVTQQPGPQPPSATALAHADAAREPARLARETTPDNPWPLSLLSAKIEAYVSKMTGVWVEAQIVQLNRRSGMSFLTLRDTSSEMSLRAAMYRRDLVAAERAMAGELTEGLRVVAHGRPTFWTRGGSLQLQLDDVRPVGTGDLLARLEQLRRVLSAEGLFAPERKRPLPFLPRVVGLVCGRDAKAKDDVIVNARLRWPDLPFEVREVAVQGAGAVGQVTAAIRELDAAGAVDVIVVARGGGAVEDLLPFSDEGLVRAAAACRTPLVSAIGHETDRPLLDEVADYRASTPTDAARRIVPDLAEETVGLDSARERIRASLSRRLDEEQARLTQVRERPVMADPTLIVRDREAELGQDLERMRRAVSGAVTLADAELRADRARLTALSPQGVLDRGYAILRKPGVGVVTSSAGLKKGDLLEGVLAQGRFVAQVVGAAKPDPDSSPRQ